MVKHIPPADKRKRMETNDLSDVNKLVREGGWELFKVEADSLSGFTYTLVERAKPTGRS